MKLEKLKLIFCKLYYFKRQELKGTSYKLAPAGDYDDNKFVDCAVAANANYIATNDKHFSKINIINIEELNEIAKKSGWLK